MYVQGFEKEGIIGDPEASDQQGQRPPQQQNEQGGRNLTFAELGIGVTEVANAKPASWMSGPPDLPIAGIGQ